MNTAGAQARRVIVCKRGSALGSFAETHNSDLLDRLFDEFNTLAVLYQKPSFTFTDLSPPSSTSQQGDPTDHPPPPLPALRIVPRDNILTEVAV
eukprot:1194554-Prorocentrum_minimum.AAC.2